MTRLRVLALLAGLTAAIPARGDDPSFNGRKLSEWATMLKEDSLPRKRRAAVLALGQLAADDEKVRPVVIPAVAKALRNDSHPSVRVQAAAVLGQQPVETAEWYVLDATEALRIEKDSDVRREVAVLLGRLGRRALPAVQPLTDLLKDPAPATRAATAEALGRIGPDARAAAPAVIPLAKDADRSVRVAAAFALGRLDPDDPEAAAAALVGVLNAERARDQKATAAGATASAGVGVMQRDAELITTAVVSLGLLGEKSSDVIDALARQLTDPTADIRQQTVLSLGKFGAAAKGAEGPLAAVFRGDPDKQVRIYAAHTFGIAFAGESKTVVPVLTARIKSDPDYEVRVAIADELGSLGPNGVDALPALREAQRDPQLKVREAATNAIRRIQRVPEKSKP